MHCTCTCTCTCTVHVHVPYVSEVVRPFTEFHTQDERTWSQQVGGASVFTLDLLKQRIEVVNPFLAGFLRHIQQNLPHNTHGSHVVTRTRAWELALQDSVVNGVVQHEVGTVCRHSVLLVLRLPSKSKRGIGRVIRMFLEGVRPLRKFFRFWENGKNDQKFYFFQEKCKGYLKFLKSEYGTGICFLTVASDANETKQGKGRVIRMFLEGVRPLRKSQISWFFRGLSSDAKFAIFLEA